LGSNGGNIENIDVSLSEILYCQFIWQIRQLQLLPTNTAELVGFWEQRNLANCPAEFVKFAAENCCLY